MIPAKTNRKRPAPHDQQKYRGRNLVERLFNRGGWEVGGGGSILAVPALIFGAGQGPREATASSLLIVGIALHAARRK